MDLDDHVCCCYRVSLRKLLNFALRERPRYASQLSHCLNAGTGCGWCIPMLKQIHKTALGNAAPAEVLLPESLPSTADEYAAAREAYLKSDRKHTF